MKLVSLLQGTTRASGPASPSPRRRRTSTPPAVRPLHRDCRRDRLPHVPEISPRSAVSTRSSSRNGTLRSVQVRSDRIAISRLGHLGLMATISTRRSTSTPASSDSRSPTASSTPRTARWPKASGCAAGPITTASRSSAPAIRQRAHGPPDCITWRRARVLRRSAARLSRRQAARAPSRGAPGRAGLAAPVLHERSRRQHGGAVLGSGPDRLGRTQPAIRADRVRP